MPDTVALSLADYERLLEAAGGDDMLIWCEQCGAWMDRNEPWAASTEDFTGCWFAATCRDQDAHLCVKGKRPGHEEIAERRAAALRTGETG
jgi:hypothetical protein